MAHAVTAAGTSPGRGQFSQQGCKVWHHFTLAFHKSAAELEAVVMEVGWCVCGQLSQSVGGRRPVLTFGDLVLTHPSPSALSPCPGRFSFWLCEEQVVPDRLQWFHLCWAVVFNMCPTAHHLGDPDTRWGLGHGQGSTVRP